ncbi:DHA2 family efflux MFS transporter permease subunit [Sphingomonas lacunae]|uniref:DHA2 family efflux MFS transporter permease subunit n=1 Tax=Sphingomonas lacunae TaxID=2698828 RepID=A0A6M4AV74_9SPHN|nr:DHA2 family efflux MFS transporter permease subunit [Sphingomonas lacunae]QJQ33003.1 DHA2 family efflux MFS transporter permease subunit [Sphingomonas lacunae]
MASVAGQPERNTVPAAAVPDTDVAALPVKHRGLLMVAVMGASIIQFLDSTIANVAIPHMQTSLGATSESVTWVLTSFIIASAVATPITGWLSDRVGSRNLFLWAVFGFLVASMLCGIAQNLTEMVLFRIFQGVCAAFIGPISQTIMLDINRPSQQAKAMAIWGMGVMIGPISGPMIGGWLTESYSWRWVFYINIPIGIPTLLMLWWLLPSRPITRRRLDYVGYLLFAIGLASLQLMLDRGQTEDWLESTEVIVELFIAVAALWMFGVYLFTAKNPIFPRGLVTNTNFLTALVYMLIMGMVMIAISALLPPMLQGIYGYSVLDTGLILAPRGVGVLISMFIASRLVTVIGPRWLIAIGFAICAYSLWMSTGWTIEMGWEPFVIVGLIQGLGTGLCFMPLNVIAFATLPPAYRTDGAGLLNLFRSIGASASISLITTLLYRNMQQSHADIGTALTPFNTPGVDLSSIDRLGPVGDGALTALNAMVTQQAAMIAYLDDFWLLTWLVALCVPLIFLAKEPKMIGKPPPISD